MSLKRNFLVGLFSSTWGALLGIAVVPLYLRYVGTEAYGLVGFFATTQALLQLLDLGLSPTINREVARCSASGNLRQAKDLLHTLAVVYWAMAGAIALIVVLVAPVVAQYWLQSKHLSQDTVSRAVMLMGFVVACRWPVGIYAGALMGMQRVALSSTINIIASTFSSLGAVMVLAFFSPTIEAFFIWQACVGLLYAMAMRQVAWRVLRGENEPPNRFSLDELKRIWRFSAGMSGIMLTGVILMQLDKLLLSKMLNLEDFGRYAVAAVVANGLYVFLTPLFNAIYPRMSALVAARETEKLTDLYKTGTRLFLIVLFPIAITAAAYSENLLLLWTRNPHLAESSAMLVSLLLLGTAINGVMHFPFALQLAYGSTRTPLIITSSLIVVYVPLVFFFTAHYGAAGGAMAWLTLNIAYLFFGTWIVHRNFLKNEGVGWLIYCVGLPLTVSVLVVESGWKIAHAEWNHYSPILWGLVFCLLAISANLALLPKAVVERLKQWCALKMQCRIFNGCRTRG